jgi:uncharacterized membrane protein YhaH (DUF805 family)
MDFQNIIKNHLKKYNQFTGRATRLEFWYFVLFVLFVSFVITIIKLLFLNQLSLINRILLIFFLLLIIIPSIAVGTRRLHDINKSGWWQLLIFTAIGLIPLIFWWTKVGEKNNNKYGVAVKSLKTLKTRLIKYNSRGTSWKYNTSPSKDPFSFEFQIRKEPIIEEQIQNTALCSYIMCENKTIIIDQLSPPSRFGALINNQTPLYSMSLGKSLGGYLMAHAISKGYIESLDQKLEDWPIATNTLLENLSLKDVLNSAMGDQDYFDGPKGIFRSSGRFPGNINIKSIVSQELLGSKASLKRYFYNQLSANVALNYISFKTGYKFRDFLNDIMTKHVGLKNKLEFIHTGDNEEEGIIQSNFRATRYDILRIGLAILKDWRNDNSIGKTLKNIYSNKISKKDYDLGRFEGKSKSYAGFFHTDYPNMIEKVVGMHGTGGTSLLINFDANRVVYAHSVYRDYNYDKIILNPIRNGAF